jgi:hypothetical protein
MKTKVVEILTSKSNDQFNDLVKIVYLSFSKEIDGKELTLPISIPFNLESPSTENFIPFNEVNDNIILEWIFSKIQDRKPVIEKMFDELTGENKELIKLYTVKNIDELNQQQNQ